MTGPLPSAAGILRRRLSRWREDRREFVPSTIPPTRSDLVRAVNTLERLLLENILPFWLPRIIDHERGGFQLNHDLRGNYKGDAPRRLVTQARTTWFFARVARSAYSEPSHRDAADHGFAFLRDRMWDRSHGGFYWELSANGDAPTRSEKHLYGQAFGLFALTEYARLTGDPEPSGLARELFRLLEENAHDRLHRGYREAFLADWSPAPPSTPDPILSRPGFKLLNTHLHLLEALTDFVRLSGDPLGRARLVELIGLLSVAVVRSEIGACSDVHAQDWTPAYGRHAEVSYGHDLENVWMLLDACAAAGLPQESLTEVCRTLFAYSLRYGIDRERGGFYYTGSWNRRAARREKVWWVQAEAMVCALAMYRFTGEGTYFDVFSRTLDWIVERQADWEHGDWHAVISEDGAPSGDKTSHWKAPYHNGRAVLHCLELLKLTLADGGPGEALS